MRRRLAIIAGVAVLIAAAWFLFLQPNAAAPEFQGWVEGDLIFVSPDEIGRIETLSVREGSKVKTGDALFALDEDLQRADVNENEAYVANAEQAYRRAQVLLQKEVGTQKARDDAEAALRSAKAKLNSAQTRLNRRRRQSPVSGTVQEIYFREGEMVQPGNPILSILPPGNIKVRFFVPQTMLPKIGIGTRVKIHCDGCRDDLMARVRFISDAAEFTPPVIYSLEERARLVFRVEAIPEDPQALSIGQPASVALTGASPAETAHVNE
jgi:HlyD family secretion protein